MDAVSVALDFFAAINANDVDRLGELLSEDHLFVDSSGAEVRGRSAVMDAWRRYFLMVPDYRVEVDAMFAAGVLLARYEATPARRADITPQPRCAFPR